MKVKIIFIILIITLLLISIAQIFSIPPYSGDIFSLYKSGYFRELDKSFQIIKDSFIEIKTMSKPVYAWIFLKDMQKENNIKIKIYNNRGLEVPAPGETKNSDDETVNKMLNSLNPKLYSYVKSGKYHAVIPVFSENKCKFCHSKINKKNIIGLMSFEREYDSFIYYSSERVIIFSIISLVLIIFLYYIIKWDPAGAVKELFDKSK